MSFTAFVFWSIALGFLSYVLGFSHGTNEHYAHMVKLLDGIQSAVLKAGISEETEKGLRVWLGDRKISTRYSENG